MWQAVSIWWKQNKWKQNKWQHSQQRISARLVMLVLMLLLVTGATAHQLNALLLLDALPLSVLPSNIMPSLHALEPSNTMQLSNTVALSSEPSPTDFTRWQATTSISAPALSSPNLLSRQSLASYAYAQATPPTRAAPWVSTITGLAVTTLVILGIVASRSVYLVRRELEQLQEALTNTQQKRHYLEHSLAQQAHRLHAWQQALEHLSDGVYHLDERGQLLTVISNNPDKTPTYNLQTDNSVLSLEGLFPHALVRDVRKLLEQTREQQVPQQHHYQHRYQYHPRCREGATQQPHTKHYQLLCFPVDSPSHQNQQRNKNQQRSSIDSADTPAPLAGGYLLIVRDISEQVALHASERRNKAILTAIPDAIGRFSRSGHYLEIINPGTFAQILTREQLEGKHMLDYLPYAVAKKMQHHIDALYATRHAQSFYYHLNSDSGKRVYRHAHLALLEGREHIAIIRDVTEQVHLERALEQSEARFREIAATVDAVFMVFDLVSQHFRYVSPTFERIVGTSRQLLYDFSDVETTFSRLIYSGDWQAFQKAFSNMSRGHEVILEYRLWHPTHGLRWLRTQVSRGHPVSERFNSYRDDLDSAITDRHMISITTDITERKQTEDALSANEARMRTILQALPDGIGRFSRQGRYLEVLHQGYYTPVAPVQDIIGKSFADVLPTDAAQRAMQHLQRVFAGSPLEVFEYDVLIHDNTHHREIYLVPFDEDSCIGVVHDITERKRAEQALSYALTEKTALLNEIHHRVKNNLQVIASLLTLHARATDEPAVKTALEANRKRVTAMATVHKLIYTSGSLSEVAFHNYLHAIVPNLLPPYSMNRVQVHFALVPLSLPIDYAIPLGIIVAELLENVFQHAFTELHQHHSTPKHHDAELHNIQNNATHHNHDRQTAPTPSEVSPTAVVPLPPTVTIALEQYQHTQHQHTQHQHIVLRVSDNGIGLPETFDSDNLNRHTSLGVSVVDALVSQIGGSWRIERLQPGTQVEVSLVVTGKTLE